MLRVSPSFTAATTTGDDLTDHLFSIEYYSTLRFIFLLVRRPQYNNVQALLLPTINILMQHTYNLLVVDRANPSLKGSKAAVEAQPAAFNY